MIEELIDRLIDLNINIELAVHNGLKINADINSIPHDILAEIRLRKEDLVQYLKSQYSLNTVGIIPCVPHSESYELSSSQRRLWILGQLKEGSIAYNLPNAYVIEGTLDIAALRWSFEMLIKRHEVLRTVLKENEYGEVKQFILSPESCAFGLECHDLRHEPEPEMAVKKLVRETFVKPFDFATGPLLRAGVFQVAHDKWIFTYVIHHIISDGWSMNIFREELSRLYNACLHGVTDPLKPLRIQYKDYAAWQQAQLNGEALLRHKSWWLKQFEGALPVLELSDSKARPALRTHVGSVVSGELDADLHDGINSLTQEQGATLFMGLLAAVNVLLYMYTHQEDIVIGTSVAGREHHELADQLGFYVNTLALRARLQGGYSY